MRHVRLNVRLVTLLAAVIVAVVAAGSLAPGARPAYAIDIQDPTGVFCADITVTLPGPLVVQGIILARFDHDPTMDFDPVEPGQQDTAVTAVPYIPDDATCQPPQSQISSPFATEPAARPSLTGTWNNVSDTIEGSTCSEEVDFGGVIFPEWTKIVIDFELTKGAKSIDLNAFSFDNPAYLDDTCTTFGGTGLGSIVVEVNGLYLDGPDADPKFFTSDWDKDGCLDWEELDMSNPRGSDPFNPADCPVGGIVELAEVDGTPLEAGSSGNNAGPIAAAAAAIAAGALALGSAAQYARRRSLR